MSEQSIQPFEDGGFDGPVAEAAVDESFRSVYAALRQLARRELRRGSNTLHTTELVHEAYVKMSRTEGLSFASDGKFFRYAAMAMRHILLDRAMRRARIKAGGGSVHVDLEDAEHAGVGRSPALALHLDAALRELEKVDPRAAQVVELHYFAGVSLLKVSEIVGMNRRTIDRDWAFARAFLESRIPDDLG
ncbi:RNA polymerase sigma factor (TIGR02999 family) [Dokdonella fugitiva]|jgi:RNA polymerase sigma factor (TIGR02999 family)|uniref:RNA polymerase sigma factor (TIGR02999 family) n=1 Tax=Dokdonella fugitiva TaxID=328517 RepID=A0A839F582_9GAMM|nr:ECF-type sigma factor [Dokdonella fugitiva]MBA8888688.1 RNA polymerase sigma factor (TIGR02999 family) [Dokdonella fugitiva]